MTTFFQSRTFTNTSSNESFDGTSFQQISGSDTFIYGFNDKVIYNVAYTSLSFDAQSSAFLVVSSLSTGTDSLDEIEKISFDNGVTSYNLVVGADGFNDTLQAPATNLSVNFTAEVKSFFVGGTGNDTYIVNSASDVIIEKLNEGNDTIQSSSVNISLGANIENGTLTGSAALNITGNSLANILNGEANSGANTLTGQGGNDTYIIGVGDIVSELGSSAGNDTIQSSTVNIALGANIENGTLTGSAALNITGNSLANVLTGNAGNNTLDGGNDLVVDNLQGGLGNDTYVISTGDIVLELANAGTDTVQTSAFSIDLSTLSGGTLENATLTGALAGLNLTGNSGNNVLNGESNTAANILTGLGGDDTYVVGAGDTIVEVASAGTDTVQSSSISLNLANYANVENATLTGALAGLNLTGNSGNNVLNGESNTAANILTGLGGNDTYVVGAGDTIVEVASAGTDTVQSSSISLNLANYANVENATLTGALAGLNLTGNSGNNVLNGISNTAANVLTGLGGDDTYVVGVGDTIVEQINAGTDTVQSSTISLNLANYANVENAILTGSATLNITGNSLANVLTGNSGNNTLDGGNDLAVDTLQGGLGNDTYVVGAGDTIVEQINAGTDTVQSSTISLDLANYLNVENATLTGALAGLNLTGNAGNNVLNGESNTAANILTGLGGNDTYVVGAGDTIVEQISAGTDTVQSSTISLDLANYLNVENATLTGALAGRNLTGNAGNNVLNGESSSAANILTGLGGNDTYVVGAGDTIVEGAGAGTDTVQSSTISLNLANYANVENATLTGAAGLSLTGNTLGNILNGESNTAANVLAGGGGNDIYIVGVGDTVSEGLLGGIDTVQSSTTSLSLIVVNYANVENATLLGSANLQLGGNAGVNILTGNSGNNSMSGGIDTVADQLIGGLGNDTYNLRVNDVVTEQINGGTDTVQASDFSLDLANYVNVENATLTGSTALNLTGNSSANVLTGNNSVNTITAGDGNDTLVGAGGIDTLTGGLGGDTFVYQFNASTTQLALGSDHITDFSAVGGDKMSFQLFDANNSGVKDITDFRLLSDVSNSLSGNHIQLNLYNSTTHTGTTLVAAITFDNIAYDFVHNNFEFYVPTASIIVS